MKNYLEKELLVSAAYVDRDCEMGPFHASLLFQDGMTELFHQYGCDAVGMSQSHGMVWAVVRSKLCYDRIPRWMEQVRLRAFPVKLTTLAVHLDSQVEALDGTPLVRCRQELCPIDVANHAMGRLNATPFPQDIELLPPVVTEPFRRRKVVVEEMELAYRHQVRTMDTDMNSHINNVAYVRLVADAFPSGFWDKHQVKTFDIQYANEGREGEALEILHRQEGQEHMVFVRAGERTLAKSFLQVQEK